MDNDERLYSCDDCLEVLTEEDPDQCVANHLDQFNEGEEPETVTLFTWKKKELPPLEDLYQWLDPLDGIIETIDEEYGPMDRSTEPSEALVEAARTFVKAIREEYKVWQCDLERQKEINVAEFLAEWNK